MPLMIKLNRNVVRVYSCLDNGHFITEYKYVLVSVGWMIVVLYIIHFVLDYIKNNSDE